MVSNALSNWIRKAVIYHILIDRFAGFTAQGALGWDRPFFVGGHLDGIADQLGYLAGLGINTIWLSPFYKTVDYHGYHITDFNAVDGRFGGIAALHNLVKACQKRRIRIIADLVPNHCHDSHPFFQEALHNKKSDYRGWFLFDAKNGYKKFLGCSWLPKLNLENEAARRYMIKNALYWLDQGLDGFRIDHVIGVSPGFLKELSAACKQKKPDCFLFGEARIELASFRRHYDTVWCRNKLLRVLFGFRQDALQKDYCGILDGVLDFKFQSLAGRFAGGTLSQTTFRKALKKHFDSYPDNFALVLFVDSHDDDRLLCRARGNEDKIRQATDILFEFASHYRHPVSIYYGFEILLNQVVPMTGGYPNEDLLPRRTMDWNAGQVGQHFREFLAQQIERHRG